MAEEQNEVIREDVVERVIPNPPEDLELERHIPGINRSETRVIREGPTKMVTPLPEVTTKDLQQKSIRQAARFVPKINQKDPTPS